MRSHFFKTPLAVRCIALFCACVLLLTCVDLFIPRGEAQVYQSVIRLHILASGDGEDEQRVKLLVRDAILEEYGDIFLNAYDIETALGTAKHNLKNVEELADRVLAEQGAGYTARAELSREEYPSREYEGFSLPAGEYYSLRVLLGPAQGQNWWCVLFPPLCFGASRSSLRDAGLDDGSSKVFTNKKYSFRFKLLELFGW